MNGGTDGHPVPPEVPSDAPITPELLADLQAGLLDDATAARLRHRLHTDPAAARTSAALDRVRRDLAHLGTDAESAADVPPAVTARIGAALRGAPALHAVRRTSRLRLFGALAGVCAAALGIGLGVATLVRPPAPTPSATVTAERITVTPAVPLPEPEIMGLLTRPPDYGALANPHRRASCLAGLGYPAATTVLGARAVDMHGRTAVLLVLPGDEPTAVVALVVEPNCSAAHTGLLANSVLTRP